MAGADHRVLSTIDYYDQYAGVFRRPNDHFWDSELAWFAELLPPDPSHTVLEIGCGDGREAEFLGQNYDYLGTDVAMGCVRLAEQNNPELRFAVSSIAGLGKFNKKFLGVWCAATLLHVPPEELPKKIRSIRSAMQAGGVGFFSVMEGEGVEMVDRVGHPERPPRLFAWHGMTEFANQFIDERFEIIDLDCKDGVHPDGSSRPKRWLCLWVKAK